MDALARSIFEKLERRTSVEIAREFLGRAALPNKKPPTLQFLYFANAEMRHLFAPEKRTAEDVRYFQALLQADYLLPDGIALSLLYAKFLNTTAHPLQLLSRYRSSADESLPNLNGTDFLPELLRTIGTEGVFSAYFYGTRAETVVRAAQFFEPLTKTPIGASDGFSPLDRTNFISSSSRPKILFVGLGTPKQELWCEENAASYGAAWAVGVGGFFDFAGGGEKRAPKFVRNLRLEWLWRVIENPKKNGKKVLVSLRFFPRLFRI